jgi:hypothetical protein
MAFPGLWVWLGPGAISGKRNNMTKPPGFRPAGPQFGDAICSEHRAEKWEPVFGKSDAHAIT